MPRVRQTESSERTIDQKIKDLKAVLVEEKKERKKLEKDIDDYRDQLRKENLSEEEKQRLELEKDIAELQLEASKERSREAGKAFSDSMSKAGAQLITDFNRAKNDAIADYLKIQTSMAYGLQGTSRSASEIIKNINSAVSGTGLVKTQNLLSNTNELIRKGISFNVEQRAFLQTLSEDLNMLFDATDGTLVRLINLQRTDLTSQRMAIQANLKEFLTQNYETSTYIVESFKSVSDALFEAQATMGVSSGMQLEAVIQQWLGGLSSVGMSSGAVSNIATALGQLGSGNISSLSGSSMQNLLVMGAARAGISYADMLTQGISPVVADNLLRGIVTYIADIGSSTSSNVVLSEYARIFGLSVSDIVAASQMNDVTSLGVVGTNIKDFLSKANSYLYPITKIENAISNLVYSMGLEAGSDPAKYLASRGADIASSLVGNLGGTGSLIAAAVSLGANLFAGGNSIADFISNIGTAIFGGGYGLEGIYNALGGSTGGMKIASTGLSAGFTKRSGLSTSGSAIISSGDLGSMTGIARTSAIGQLTDTVTGKRSIYDVTDIYQLLETVNESVLSLPLSPYAAVARIAESANTVTIGNDLTYIQDMITLSAMNLQNIYSLLSSYFSGTGAPANIVDTSTWQWNNSLDWVTNPSAQMNTTMGAL